MPDHEQITLKEHLDAQCKERMKQHAIHFQRVEEHLAFLGDSARAKFESVDGLKNALEKDMERRLTGMDRDLEHRFPTRADFEAMKRAQEESIRGIREEFKEILQSAAADLRELRDFRMSLSGKATQADVSKATGIAMSGLGIAVLACLAAVINTILVVAKP